MAKKKDLPKGRPLTEDEKRQDQAMGRYGRYQDDTAPEPTDQKEESGE